MPELERPRLRHRPRPQSPPTTGSSCSLWREEQMKIRTKNPSPGSPIKRKMAARWSPWTPAHLPPLTGKRRILLLLSQLPLQLRIRTVLQQCHRHRLQPCRPLHQPRPPAQPPQLHLALLPKSLLLQLPLQDQHLLLHIQHQRRQLPHPQISLRHPKPHLLRT